MFQSHHGQPKRIQFSIRLTKGLNAALETYCRKFQRPKNFVIEEALLSFFEDSSKLVRKKEKVG